MSTRRESATYASDAPRFSRSRANRAKKSSSPRPCSRIRQTRFPDRSAGSDVVSSIPRCFAATRPRAGRCAYSRQPRSKSPVARYAQARPCGRRAPPHCLPGRAREARCLRVPIPPRRARSQMPSQRRASSRRESGAGAVNRQRLPQPALTAQRGREHRMGDDRTLVEPEGFACDRLGFAEIADVNLRRGEIAMDSSGRRGLSATAARYSVSASSNR